jgi:hypothetical protein
MAVVIKARGAALGVINDKVFAFLIEEARRSMFEIVPTGDGTVQVKESASGKVLSLPTTERSTQAQLAEEDSPNSRWTLNELDEEPTDKVVRNGQYYLRLPGTDVFLGRNQIEDRSLRPKQVGVPDRGDPELLEIILKR